MPNVLQCVLLLPFLSFGTSLFAQSDTSGTFEGTLEFRPRAEYRNGYRTLPTADDQAAFFSSHRSRLLLTHKRKSFKFHTSLQDVRIWGEDGINSTSGTVGVFEAYVEANFSPNWSLKLGRQAVELDNGRIFSRANWNQFSRAHDGVNLIYRNEKVVSELMTYFNQTTERVFETDYDPVEETYKLLNLHHLKVKLSDQLELLTINAADGYQSSTSSRVLYVRGTSGGRLTWSKNNLTITASGYFQYGALQSGQEVSAYYFQPEIRYKHKKITTRLGMEYLSGDKDNSSLNVSTAFEPLYGVAFKFMGNLNYFTQFPEDAAGGGLMNPYLFIDYKLNKKLKLKVEGHLFFTQTDVLNVQDAIDPYLGFENDIKIKYTLNHYAYFNAGVAYMMPTASMEFIKGRTADRTPLWSYLMVTFKPQLFKLKTKDELKRKVDSYNRIE